MVLLLLCKRTIQEVRWLAQTLSFLNSIHHLNFID